MISFEVLNQEVKYQDFKILTDLMPQLEYLHEKFNKFYLIIFINFRIIISHG